MEDLLSFYSKLSSSLRFTNNGLIDDILVVCLSYIHSAILLNTWISIADDQFSTSSNDNHLSKHWGSCSPPKNHESWFSSTQYWWACGKRPCFVFPVNPLSVWHLWQELRDRCDAVEAKTSNFFLNSPQAESARTSPADLWEVKNWDKLSSSHQWFWSNFSE